MLVVSALAVLLGSSPARAEDGKLGSTDVEAFVSDYLEHAGTPGMTVVVTHGDKIISAAGYGQDSNGRALDENSRMPVASLSKSFTALAMLQLVEQGAVDLDLPVVRYLPEFVTTDPRSAAITVRQLLNQTSGMSDQGFREKTEPQPRDLAGAVARLETAELVADPGTEWHYTNPNFQVAARLIEVVSNEPFADYLRRHVFAPLGMERTASVNTTEDMTVAVGGPGHLMIGTLPVPMDEPLQFLAGSSGIITTAADLGRWLIALHQGGELPDGGRLLSPAGMAELRAPSAVNPDYALGWELGHTAGGAPQFGHGGIECTFTADQTLVPGPAPAADGLGVAVMSNTGYGRSDSTSVAQGLVALAEGRDAGQASTTPPAAIVDWVMLALTAITLAWGIRQSIRARVWARGRSDIRRWRTVLRLGLPAIPVAVLLSAPSIVRFLTNGRDLNWVYTFFAAPTVVVFLGVWAVTACISTLARIRHLVVSP